MELEYRWSSTPSGGVHNLLCRTTDSQLDRWDNVATLWRDDDTHFWKAKFDWRIEALLTSRAYIFRQKWDDIDKAKKAVERKARGMVGVLQIRGEWP